VTESLLDCQQRASLYFEQEIKPYLLAGATVLVVAHANTIRALVKTVRRVWHVCLSFLYIFLLYRRCLIIEMSPFSVFVSLVLVFLLVQMSGSQSKATLLAHNAFGRWMTSAMRTFSTSAFPIPSRLCTAST
jgi:hypothetical protein